MAIKAKRDPDLLLKKLSCLNSVSLQAVLVDLFSVAAVQNGGFYPLKRPFLCETDAGEIESLEDRVDFESYMRFVDAVGPVEHIGGDDWLKIRAHEEWVGALSLGKEIPFCTHMDPRLLPMLYFDMDVEERKKLLCFVNRPILDKLDSFITEDRFSAETMLDYFHHCLDGKDCISGVTIEDTMEGIGGINFISDAQQMSSSDFIPGSSIEEKAFEYCGQHSDVDYKVFTVEKDGFQSLVWVVDQHYECSDWIYDTFNDRLEKLPYSEKLERLRDDVSRLYDMCDKTNEVVIGSLSKSLLGKATWSRGLDLDLPGIDDVRGLRFIQFADKSVEGYVLKCNGEATPVKKSSAFLLSSVLNKAKELKKGVKKNKAMRGPDLPW